MNICDLLEFVLLEAAYEQMLSFVYFEPGNPVSIQQKLNKPILAISDFKEIWIIIYFAIQLYGIISEMKIS